MRGSGWHYIPFTLVIHVSKIKVNGRFKLSLAPDLSYAWVSFEKDMVVSMTITCEVRSMLDVSCAVVQHPLAATLSSVLMRLLHIAIGVWCLQSILSPRFGVLRADHGSLSLSISA